MAQTGPTGRVYPDLATDGASPPPPAGAYYNVKDQPIPPPATYQAAGRRRGRGPCCCFFTCLCSVLVSLVIVLGIVTLVIWLVVQPRAIKYDVENVTVSGLNGSGSNSISLNTSVALYIRSRNPNKHIGYYYDAIVATVEMRGVTIGEGNLEAGFYQGHKTTSYINGTVSSTVPLTSENLNVLPMNQSYVSLYVKLDVKGRLKIESWNPSKKTLKVRCNINVDLTKSEGNQLISWNCWQKK